MYSYVTEELPSVVSAHFHIDLNRQSITGFSMGGLGALSIYLKNQSAFKSVSAFSPISNPTQSHWGQQAYGTYLASVEDGNQYDPTVLVSKLENGSSFKVLIDQGSNDKFAKNELLTENFVKAAQDNGGQVQYRNHEGYGHDFFFVGTFIGDHIDFHARYLLA